MRRRNPLNQQMIDIWDQAIMLIEDKYDEWRNYMYGGGKSNLADDTTRVLMMEMTNRRDYFRALSWYILQWAAMPEDSVDAYENIDESARKLIETQRRQADFVEVNLIKDILRVVSDLQDPHDLTDYAFMVYQLYQICRYLLMHENMNSDRYRVAADLAGLNNQVPQLHGIATVLDVRHLFELKPQPASQRAHQLTEAHQWGDYLYEQWPPVEYQWMGFWVPNI